MSVVFGLTAALCWGAADMVARAVTRHIGTVRTMLFMQAFGFGALTLVLGATGTFAQTAHTGWGSWAWAVVAALLSAVGSLALYRAFEIGIISVVSPIAATYAAVAVALALLTGTRLSVQHGVGIALALTGVLLAAMGGGEAVPAGGDVPLGAVPPHTVSRAAATQGIVLAATTSVFFGLAFWLFGWQVTPVLGGFAPVWVVRLMSMTLAGGIVLLRGPAGVPLRATRSQPTWLWGALAALALLDTAAYIANVDGLTTGDVAVVDVLSSLFSAVTVLLAWIFLRERLLGRQWLGIVIIFLGVALVSL